MLLVYVEGEVTHPVKRAEGSRGLGNRMRQREVMAPAPI